MNLSGGGKKGIRTVDTNMQKLVGDYLTENCERTYIDMEDMIAALQTKSYHFSRMKKQTFANLVRNAYYIYCDQNQIYNDTNNGGSDVAGAGTGRGPGPGIGQPPADSDSDIEIEEPVRTAMSNQMTGLYQRAPPAARGTPQQTPSASTSRIPQDSAAGRPFMSLSAVRKNQAGTEGSSSSLRNPNSNLNPRQRGPLEKVDSSSSSSLTSDSMLLVDVDVDPPLDDDDDDDLEIIEEHSAPTRTQPILNANALLSRRNLMQKDKTVPEQLDEALRRGSKALPSSVIGVPVSINVQLTSNDKGTQALIPDKFEQETEGINDKAITKGMVAGRGIKRSRAAVRAEAGDSIPAPATPRVASTPKPKEGGIGNLTKKLRKEIAVVQESNYTFADFGGSEKVLEEICKLLMHLKHPEMYRTLGVTPPRGFLLHGPPGCGKTLLANAIAGELKMSMLKMAATELISGISGESENNIRDLFDQALGLAPCIIFIDEIDSITPKRETAQREMERRIVAQLLACIDDLINKEKGDQVLLIGATNRIETIDTALRRAGRFDREICLGIPDERAREKIFRVISRGLKLEANFSFELLAKLTPGYVGADLQALVREAAVQSVTDILTNQSKQSEEPMDQDSGKVTTKIPDKSAEDGVNTKLETLTITSPIESLKWIKEVSPLSQEELDGFCIHMKDFERALKNVQPSSKREGFVTVPDTTWDDIGALKEIRDELQVSILGPVKHSAAFQALGLNSPAGVLLCGPPGCGKTLLAKAVANEAGINFISVKGPELLNMYVGESERAVRQCFLRAKNSSPCVIFFDELDALCPRRSDGGDSGSSSRVVNQLLTEMDGMESRLGVFVMAATNRPDIVDPAILRPGRLDKILFVNLPTASDRVDILKAITKRGTKPILADDVNIDDIGNNEKCENYTGADLASLIRETGIAAFRELILDPGMRNESVCSEQDLKVYKRHFDVAFTKTKPSVSKKDREKYDQMKEKYSSLSSQ